MRKIAISLLFLLASSSALADCTLSGLIPFKLEKLSEKQYTAILEALEAKGFQLSSGQAAARYHLQYEVIQGGPDLPSNRSRTVLLRLYEKNADLNSKEKYRQITMVEGNFVSSMPVLFDDSHQAMKASIDGIQLLPECR